MKRTTIMADEELLARLRAIALREDVSLAEVIRQGLEWRARQPRPRPSFIGSVSTGDAAHDTAERAGEAPYEPRSWR